MMAYVILAIAIASEVLGSSMLKLSGGFSKLLPSVLALVSYGASFYFLSQALKLLPLSVAYAIWAGVGTALTALIGVLIWKDSFSIQTLLGLTAIICGVAVLNMPKWT
ncbi:DMT family transporter [Salinibacillus xinjiangensis]|uniref:QacE family quaternary ammonium compound efflux SMR transporter n=1 Tax=Salinibacillus xinjiangensis TaxID=1229268 RepID=A0A6G1X2U7_9BACI|nr:multidrug efflux SMR transporter [Salinibacillus xinjiangensis]MRG85239.1 QacE family quaternary ammonium compound efflux SMR transporter [Salinibacillus xinjiangensis]